MERLTYDFCIGEKHCWQIKGADNFTCKEVCENQDGCEKCPIAEAFDRLAAYIEIKTLGQACGLIGRIGETRLLVSWYLTREEAEAALKKRVTENETD